MSPQGTLSGETADNPESPFADDTSSDPETEVPENGQASLRGWGKSQGTLADFAGGEQ